MQYHNQQGRITLLWLFATMIGTVFGIVSSLTLVTGLALDGAPPVLVGITGGCGLGVGIGLAQWLVLRRHIPAAGWWVLASIGGGISGVVLALPLSEALQPLFAMFLGETLERRPTVPRVSWSDVLALGVTGAVVGLVLGSAQWLVLRRHARSAGWWIGASSVGWMAGLSISTGSVSMIGLPLSLLILGAAIGAATGGVLVYLLSGGAATGSAAAA
jgi:hypothetical protein